MSILAPLRRFRGRQECPLASTVRFITRDKCGNRVQTVATFSVADGTAAGPGLMPNVVSAALDDDNTPHASQIVDEFLKEPWEEPKVSSPLLSDPVSLRCRFFLCDSFCSPV